MHKLDFVLWLKGIRKKDINLVGGKAANLGELYSNFEIPNGFCITVKAFEHFLNSNDIMNGILSLIKIIHTKNIEKTDLVSDKIKRLIIQGKMPKELSDEIIKNYKKLNDYVAVRSSAVSEDLEKASFAGQQATFLNVKGGANLIKYVKQCWASFYGERAIIYREENKFSHEPQMAVVVQKMVNANKSGVVFTINPVNKNRNEVVIEAIFGLGEAIVAGIVTPDHYIIDKKRNNVVKEIISAKNVAIKRINGKNKTIKLDSKTANSKVLDNRELLNLIDVSLQIEKYYKKPMDIEWAIDDKLYILQARPITTL